MPCFGGSLPMWAIVIKARIGKLKASLSDIEDTVADGGFTHLPIDRRHLATLADLPAHHRDPFDHLLIAQAIAEARFDDSAMPLYPVSVMRCGS